MSDKQNFSSFNLTNFFKEKKITLKLLDEREDANLFSFRTKKSVFCLEQNTAEKILILRAIFKVKDHDEKAILRIINDFNETYMFSKCSFLKHNDNLFYIFSTTYRYYNDENFENFYFYLEQFIETVSEFRTNS